MMFKTFDGKLLFVLHQPNNMPASRAYLFEVLDEGDKISLRPHNQTCVESIPKMNLCDKTVPFDRLLVSKKLPAKSRRVEDQATSTDEQARKQQE